MTTLDIDGKKIRIDKETGYFCLTDMAKAKDKDTSRIIGRWLRTTTSIQFFQSWENHNNPSPKPPDFGGFKNLSGENTFSLSVQDLVGEGATGIFAKRGRYGGTYAHIDWTIHFANWLDPDFYVLTIAAFRTMSDLLFGREHLEQRFSRELAAQSYGLVTGGKGLEKIPYISRPPTPSTKGFKKGNARQQVARRLSQFDADIINISLFGMTAAMWRKRFPQNEAKVNMRDFATTEELKVLSALQAQMRELQKRSVHPRRKVTEA